MSATALRPTPRERRLARHLAARSEAGLVEALLELKGTRFGSRYECVSLYAVGGEGAVFLARDLVRPSPLRVAKIALLPFHRPFELDAATVSKRRTVIEVEARYLAGTGGTFLPKHLGTFDFENPLLDPARGGVFAEPGPAIIMERLPGHDLDRWLARAHRSELPRSVLRSTLDGVTATLLRAVAELLDRDLLYADLRPANLRMLPRPRRHARLLDAGSLVTVYDRSGRFPHVPAYLPPHLLAARGDKQPILPSPAVQAVMAGRTLYEVATGRVPHPGEEIDEDILDESPVSPHVAELIAALARGEFADAREALGSLAKPRARPATAPHAPAAGLGYGPSMREAMRRRRMTAQVRLQDGLQSLLALTRTGLPDGAPPPHATPDATGADVAAAGGLIEVPRGRLVLPSRGIDEAALRAGLTSPAVADAIGRLARGEFQDPADALRYARAAPSHWPWIGPPAGGNAPDAPRSDADPPSAEAPAPPTPPPGAGQQQAAAATASPVATVAPLPIRAPTHRSLFRRITDALRRLLVRTRA